ncbi:type II toxin-antitoxin system PemK/MazF family toxin [Ornithinimicrobium sp. Arc0846-15]|nr:type II toxin-antitoxin system PemK/MazF family toxin [Ornithinimicrobium laminariae]
MNWSSTLRRVARVAYGVAMDASRQSQRQSTKPHKPRNAAPAGKGSDYPGDYNGTLRPEYAPVDDDLPDPGEIVWSWVPYEEDYSQGKDRPVLVIARENSDWLLALQLTSKDHDQDAAQEARAGRFWTDIGSGDWDEQRRPSEVRVNRILRIEPTGVRRIGAVLSRDVFNDVAREVAKHN